MGPREPQDTEHPPGTPALQHMSHTSLMVASGMLASTHTSDAPSSTLENSLTYANQYKIDKCYSYTLNLSLKRTCDLGLTGLLTKVVEYNEVVIYSQWVLQMGSPILGRWYRVRPCPPQHSGSPHCSPRPHSKWQWACPPTCVNLQGTAGRTIQEARGVHLTIFSWPTIMYKPSSYLCCTSIHVRLRGWAIIELIGDDYHVLKCHDIRYYRFR